MAIQTDGAISKDPNSSTSQDINSPDIDGGTIDNTVIGGTTPAAGTFTTLTGTTVAGGMVASDAETITGEATDHVVTPANITARFASPPAIGTTLAGIAHTLIDEDLEPAADTITANQCAGGQINNIGQGAADINLTLPAAVEGYSFVAQVGEPSANYWRFTAATAGTMIVDGVVGKNYAQFSTPGIGNYFIARTAKVAPQTAGILTGAALAIGSTPTAVANGAFTYYIGGTKYAKDAVAAGTAPGNDVIPQSKYGAVAFDIGADGTIDAIEAADNATGYDSAALAIAGIAAAASDHARMGTVTAMKSDGAFTFGTTNLDAANTTVAYTSTAAYTAVYNWIVSTGAGTVSTN